VTAKRIQFANSGLAILLCAAFVACSTSWITRAQAIIQVLVPATTNILTLVSVFSGKAIDPAVVNEMARVTGEVNADLNQLAGLIGEYQALPADQRSTEIEKINTVLGLAQGHASELMSTAHVKDPLVQAKVNAVIGIVISELHSIEQIVPLLQNQANAQVARSMRAHPPLSADELKKAFNSAMAAPSGREGLDQVTRTLVLK
jgi:hypothetical protein